MALNLFPTCPIRQKQGRSSVDNTWVWVYGGSLSSNGRGFRHSAVADCKGVTGRQSIVHAPLCCAHTQANKIVPQRVGTRPLALDRSYTIRGVPDTSNCRTVQVWKGQLETCILVFNVSTGNIIACSTIPAKPPEMR